MPLPYHLQSFPEMLGTLLVDVFFYFRVEVDMVSCSDGFVRSRLSLCAALHATAPDDGGFTVQAKEAEALRVTAESRAAESAYSSKKLTGELEASHDDARRAADRDRRALRILREGLEGVEVAVAARGQMAAQQASSVFCCMLLHSINQSITKLKLLKGSGFLTGI